MNKTITPSEVKARASKLRDILASHGHQLKHTESLEVISKLEGAADWNTYSAILTKIQKTLERNPENRNAEIPSSTRDPRKTPDERETLYCSFCDKSQHEVLKLIAGPNVFICDQCTDLCIDIVMEEISQIHGELRDMPTLSSLIREAQDKANRSESGD